MSDCYVCQHGHEETRDHVDDLVARFGFAIMTVPGRAPFCYTVGMWDRGLPEFIVVGLSPRQGHEMLNNLVHHCVADGLLPLNIPFDAISTPDSMLIEVADVYRDRYLAAAIDHNSECGPVWQLLWPDRDGLYPGDPSFSLEFLSRQPLLSRR